MTNPRNKFSPEVRERTVRLVRETRADHRSEWAAITSVATKIGCVPQTLQKWLQQAEENSKAPLSDEERIRLLERENKELKRTNEILRLASAFFAQAELDRPSKKR